MVCAVVAGAAVVARQPARQTGQEASSDGCGGAAMAVPAVEEAGRTELVSARRRVPVQ